MNKQLIDYVREELKKGTPKEKLEENLVKFGSWTKEDIFNAVSMVQFNYKKYSMFLVYAGIIGLTLSLIYMNMPKSFNFVDYVSKERTGLNTNSYYYLINSFLLLFSGIFLRYKNKIGLALFILATFTIFTGLFIVAESEAPYSIGNNLFIKTILISILGAFGTIGATFFGMIFFLYFWFVNLLKIKDWLIFLKFTKYNF
jgi:hypothetical protein